ncbi:MAG: hypothetical protein ACREJY_02095 [Candidatus Rokuibacteriota bacterium]
MNLRVPRAVLAVALVVSLAAPGAAQAFRLKLILIVAALLNAGAFHRWPFRSVARWDVAADPPARAKMAAVLSLLLWAGVVSCGRLLAYF